MIGEIRFEVRMRSSNAEKNLGEKGTPSLGIIAHADIPSSTLDGIGATKRAMSVVLCESTSMTINESRGKKARRIPLSLFAPSTHSSFIHSFIHSSIHPFTVKVKVSIFSLLCLLTLFAWIWGKDHFLWSAWNSLQFSETMREHALDKPRISERQQVIARDEQKK